MAKKFCNVNDTNQQDLAVYIFKLLGDYKSFGKDDITSIVTKIYNDVFENTGNAEQALLYASITPYWVNKLLNADVNKPLKKKLSPDFNELNRVLDELDEDKDFKFLMENVMAKGTVVPQESLDADRALQEDLEQRLKREAVVDKKLNTVLKRRFIATPTLWVTTGTDVDKDDNVNPLNIFNFTALRALLNSLKTTPSRMMGKVNVTIGNSGALYLKLVSLKDLMENNSVEGPPLVDESQVVYAVVDAEGNYVHFKIENETIEVADPAEGKVPYFEIMDEKTMDARKSKVLDSIATMYFDSNKPLTYEDLLPEEKIEADSIYEKEMSILKTALDYARKNPGQGVLFRIKGGNFGDTKSAKIKDVKFDKENPFNPLLDRTTSGTDIPPAYFLFKGRKYIFEATNGLSKEDAATVTSLIFDDIYDKDGKPLTPQQRRAEINKFINVNIPLSNTSNMVVNTNLLQVEIKDDGTRVIKTMYNPKAEFNGIVGQIDLSMKKLSDIRTLKDDKGNSIPMSDEKIRSIIQENLLENLEHYNISENGINAPDRFSWPSLVRNDSGKLELKYDTSVNYITWLQTNPKFIISNPTLPNPYLITEPTTEAMDTLIKKDPKIVRYLQQVQENLQSYKDEHQRREKEYNKLAQIADRYNPIPMNIFNRPNIYGLKDDKGKWLSAFDLVVQGYRTKTTRAMDEYKAYGEPKPGDLRWVENKAGERVLVKITDVYLTPDNVLSKQNKFGLREISRAEWAERNKKEGWLPGSVNDKLSFNIEFEVIKLSTFAGKPLNAPKEKPKTTGFQGYKYGYDEKGKGTPEGDGKDKAMRKDADGAIVEFKTDKTPSSSMTSLDSFESNDYSYSKDRYVGVASLGDDVQGYRNKVMMLARNGKLSGTKLNEDTKAYILKFHKLGVEFLVGDMPGVDSQFIDYLQEIGAKFTIYHTGPKGSERIKLEPSAQTQPSPQETFQGNPKLQPYLDKLRTLKRTTGKKSVRLVDPLTGESVSYQVESRPVSKGSTERVYMLEELVKNKGKKVKLKDSQFRDAGIYAYLDFVMNNQDKNIIVDKMLSGMGARVLEKLEALGVVSSTGAAITGQMKAPKTEVPDVINIYNKSPYTYNVKAVTAAVNAPAPSNVEQAPTNRVAPATKERKTATKTIINPKRNLGLKKIRTLKGNEVKATPEQIEAARKWWKSHPLSKYFELDDAFDAANQEMYGDAIAVWELSGITLFMGADYSDVYHEAWHAFSQTFLKPEERSKLYKEVAKYKGSFKDANGNTVEFSKATEDQLEEYIAEDFRSYVLSGGNKMNKPSPVKKNIFQRIWNALKELFSLTTVKDMAMDSRSHWNIHNYYENLRLGDLTGFTFDAANRSADKLKKTIRSINESDNQNQSYTYTQSKKVVDTIDGIISQLVLNENEQNGNKRATVLAYVGDDNKMAMYGYVRDVLENDTLPALRYYLADLQDELAGNPAAERAQEIEVEIANTTDNIYLLNKVLADFGSLESMKANANLGRGVIYHHMLQSELITDEERKNFEEDILESKTERTGYDIGPQDRSLVDLAKPEVIRLIKSLHIRDRNKNSVANDLLAPKLVDFVRTWNHLAKNLENLLDADKIYNKLVEMRRKGDDIADQLLERMGPLDGKTSEEADVDPLLYNLWTNFWQAFNKPRVQLVQMTFEKTEDGNYKATVGYASGTYKKVITSWSRGFGVRATEFIKEKPFSELAGKEVLSTSYMDLQGVLRKYPVFPRTGQEAVNFLNDIGIKMSNTPAIREQIENAPKVKEGVKYIHDRLSELYQRGISVNMLGDIFREYVISDTEVLYDQHQHLNMLANLEAKSGLTVSNFMSSTATGATQFEHSLNSSLSRYVYEYNTSSSLDDLVTRGQMNHMDPSRNPWTRRSIHMNSLYDRSRDGIRRIDALGNRVEMKVDNISGIKTIEFGDERGVKTAEADPFSKAVLDFHSFHLRGAPELMTMSDKTTTLTAYVTSIHNPFILDNKNFQKHKYIDDGDFLVDEGVLSIQKGDEFATRGDMLWYKIMSGYLYSELERIREARKILDIRQQIIEGKLDPQNAANRGRFDYDYAERGSNFQVFDDILDKEQKNALLKRLDDFTAQNIEDRNLDFHEYLEQTDPDLEALVFDNILRYLNFQETENTKILDKANFIEPQIITRVSENLDKKIGSDKNLRAEKKEKVSRKDLKKAAIRSYVANSFIHNIENMIMIYGDVSMYKINEDEFHKRNAGFNSTGDLVRVDQSAIDYANAIGKPYAMTLPGMLVNTIGSDASFNTAIFEDSKQTALFLDDYKKVFLPYFIKRNNGNTEKAKAEMDKALDTGYDGMKEGDAQGWVTFDFYRQLLVLMGKWDWTNQERLFQDIVSGKDVSVEKIVKFFPVKKMQYQGPIALSGLPLNAMHKFSLMPLIPNVIKDTNLEKLHNRMMRDGVDYAAFKTASKVSTVTKADGKADLFYSDNKEKVFDMGKLTHNKIFMHFLKDQLETGEEFKGKNRFPTQMRKLIIEGLVANGVPVDFMTDAEPEARIREWEKLSATEKQKYPKYVAFRKYENLLAELTEAKYAELLDQIGWTRDPKTDKPKGNLKDLLKYVEKNLELQDLAAHELDFIKLENGKLKRDFSFSFSSEQIERLLNALVVNALIKQNVKGEGLIQVSRAGWEKPTLEQYEKYGKDLPFYKPVFDSKGKHVSTTAMKIKIALQGDFRKLLDLEDVKELAETAEVQRIANNIKSDPRLVALNMKLKDDNWLNEGDNRAMVTMVACRIPTQGLNSMEFMEVYEFLPENAGNIIIMPSEIVGKTGSDFDIDKMYTMMPSIYSVGGQVKYIRHTGKKISPISKKALNEYDNDLNERINDVYAKYDDIFDRRDKKNEFAFTPEQRMRLEEMRNDFYQAMKPLNKKMRELQKTEEKYYNGELTIYEAENLDTQLYELREDMFMLNDAYRQKQDELLKTLNSEVIESIKKQRSAELKPLFKELAETRAKLYANTSKGVSNGLITSMREILEMPDNFISFIRPNATDIFDDLSQEMSQFSSEYDPYMSINNEGTRTAIVKGKEKKVISGTRLFEIGFNLHKRMHNSVGKQVLGIGAVENTYNVLYNRIGMYMNRYSLNMSLDEYEAKLETVKELESEIKAEKNNKKRDKLIAAVRSIKKEIKGFANQTILMPHNTLEISPNESVISLSHVYTVDGRHKISDIISQMINGWVDVAKDSWIFNVQGNKEVAPTLLFLVEAGVPIEQAVYFVTQPLIRLYVEKQRAKKSMLAGPMGVAPESPNLFRYESRKEIMKEFGIMKLRSYEDKKTGQVVEYIDSDDLYEATDKYYKDHYQDIYEQQNLLDRLYEFKNTEQYTDMDKAAFLHFIQLEDMSKASQTFKMTTNVDTSRAKTLMEASAKELAIASLEAEGRIPGKMIAKIKDESVLSSFFDVLGYQQQIWNPFFKIKDHPNVKRFLLQTLSGTDRISILEKTFGNDMDGITKFYKTFLNDLMTKVFQDTLYDFDLRNLEYYKGYELETMPTKRKGAKVVPLLYSDHPVLFKDGKVYVDKEKLYSDFLNLDTLKSEYDVAPVKRRMFANEMEYFRFVFERELIRSITPMSKISDNFYFKNRYTINRTLNADKTVDEVQLMTYEEVIKDMALMKSFNIKSMFFTNSGAGNNKTMGDVLELIKDRFPSLKTKFQLLETLSMYKSGGVSNIRLEDSPKDGNTLSMYNEQMKDLMNPEMLPKDISEQDKEFITFFFDKLPFFSILQSGYDTATSVSIQRIMPWDKYMLFMDKVAKELEKGLDNEETSKMFMSYYMDSFRTQNKIDNKFRNRVKQYNLTEEPLETVSVLMDPSIVETYKKEEYNPLQVKTDYNGDSYFIIKDHNPKEETLSQYMNSIEEMVKNNKDMVFVFNDALEINPRTFEAVASKNDWVLKKLQVRYPENIIGIPTRTKYGKNPSDSYIQEDQNGIAEDKFYQAFEEAMESLDAAVADGKKLVFNGSGYGQMLVSRDDATGARLEKPILSKVQSPGTFDYISSVLLSKFGYLNPGYQDPAVIENYQKVYFTNQDVLDQIFMCKGRK